MAETPSGFVDFNQFNKLNADEEARLFEQAMAEAEAATEREKMALIKARREGEGRYDKNGQIVGAVDDISKTASYGDYLQAKRDAAAAWAKMTKRSMDPRLAAVQGAAMTPEQRAATGGAGGAAQAREDAAAGAVQSGFRGNARIQAEREAAAKAKAEAEKARAAADKEARQGFYDSIYRDLSAGQWEGDFKEGMTEGDVKQRSRWLNTGVEAGDWSPPKESIKKSIYRQAWGAPGGQYDPRTGRPKDDEKGDF